MAKKRKFTAADIAALRTSLNEGRVTELPLELVEPDPGQPRRTFTDASLQDLAADIARNGVLQPITVAHTDQGWQIVMGERRWRAAKLSNKGNGVIPALLATSNVDDGAASSDWMLERRLQQFTENHHREPLPPMDLAYFLRGLRDDLGLSATQIAASLKERGVREMGRSYVSNTIRLTELPERYQALISDGQLAPTSGKYLLMLEDLGEAGFAALDERLVPELDDLEPGERITAPDVQRLVGRAFYKLGCQIDKGAAVPADVVNALSEEGLPYTRDIVFDRAECKSCPKRQPYTTVNGKRQTWCLDPAAFLQKQRDALKAIQGGAPVPEGVEVELDLFGPAERGDDDGGTPEMPPAGPAHITPKQREAGLRRKVHDHLVEWLRPRIVKVFEEEPIQRSIAFVLWAAFVFPLAKKDWQKQPIIDQAQTWHLKFITPALAGELSMADPLQAGDIDDRQLDSGVREYVRRAVPDLDASRVWRWSIALDVQLDGYNITQGYFDCCDKSEVEIIAKKCGLTFSASTTKGKLMAAIIKASPDYVPPRATEVFEDTRNEHLEAVRAWTEQMRVQDAAAVDGGEGVREQAAA